MKDTLRTFGIKIAAYLTYAIAERIGYRVVEYVNEQRIKRHYITIEIKD